MNFHSYSTTIILLGILLAFTSCNTTKFLKDGETFIGENKVEVAKSDKDVKTKKLTSELEKLIIQTPNDKFFGIPRSYFYYVNSSPGDTLWFNNFFRDKLGETPIIYDSLIARKTVDNMTSFLRNKKGYYHAEVDFDFNKRNHYTDVIYRVNPMRRYYVGNVSYVGIDTTFNKILTAASKHSLIKTGSPIDESLFNEEKVRLVKEFQDKGYANFIVNHINILGDSIDRDHKVDIFFEILPPLPDSTHRPYYIGDINVFTDYRRNQSISHLSFDQYKGYNYYKENDDFIVKPKAIEKLIFIDQDQPFSRSDREKTFRKLSRLGTYRFVAIDPVVREGSGDTLDYNIFLSPHKNLWTADFGTDAFYATLNQSVESRNRLLGVSVNSLFKNRNFLGGAEQFSISTETGVELELRNPINLRTLTLGMDNSLQFPNQLDLFGISTVLKAFDEKFYKSFNENTETVINAGFSYIDIKNFYAISTVRSNYSYSYQPRVSTKVILRQLGLDLNIYNIKDGFQDELDDNPLLKNSFQNNLLTGYLFRDVSLIHTNGISNKGKSQAYILNFEVSGWETYLANKIGNAIIGDDKVWRLGSLDFSKYIRFDSDLRFYNHLNDAHTLVMRLYSGIIIPFGENKYPPYIRQFSVGGPNSLRAWNQKELGPGGFDNRQEYIDNPQRPFYQQGDFRLEANVEYRFDMFWFFEGALFVDAGNVWNLRADPLRPNAKISSSFLSEIAIGAGYGVRLDFDYFNIRFDFGYKIKTPYQIENNSNWITWSSFKEQGLGNFQVAVNYPF